MHQPMATNVEQFRCFEPINGFVDDIHGEIVVSKFEQTCIDSPEFQRLFRVSQLGFVDLVFQTANHTRGAHSIGVCHIAQKLIETLIANSSLEAAAPPITTSERILIRLGALLHDISHGPFSHDIERKSHKLPAKGMRVDSFYGNYPKHDKWTENPALFVFLFDVRRSVLARILKSYSTHYYELLRVDSAQSELVRHFFEALKRFNVSPEVILPQLLFHLLAVEHEDEAPEGIVTLKDDFESKEVKWHLGWKRGTPTDPKMAAELHRIWYQPYRHDIIGNTLSADLLDYLLRDTSRMKIERGFDLHLLHDYCRVDPKGNGYFRCAINISDDKRGVPKTEH
jgi:HD superfamily phosphohydrolase